MRPWYTEAEAKNLYMSGIRKSFRERKAVGATVGERGRKQRLDFQFYSATNQQEDLEKLSKFFKLQISYL